MSRWPPTEEQLAWEGLVWDDEGADGFDAPRANVAAGPAVPATVTRRAGPARRRTRRMATVNRWAAALALAAGAVSAGVLVATASDDGMVRGAVGRYEPTPAAAERRDSDPVVQRVRKPSRDRSPRDRAERRHQPKSASPTRRRRRVTESRSGGRGGRPTPVPVIEAAEPAPAAPEPVVDTAEPAPPPPAPAPEPQPAPATQDEFGFEH